MRHPRPLLARAAEYARKHSLIAEGDHVLAAVSGGPDSVALLDVLTRLKACFGIRQITVAHFDHRLRAAESDRDREFVRELARGAGLAFQCGTADVRAVSASEKISLEMAARICRHAFLRETAARLGARKTAFGHTANDQAEEVLLRIIRGTGPAGAKAMLPRTASGIIRPLLFATRDDILRHIAEHDLDYRNDSSNTEPFCQRNVLRLEIFPLLRKTFHPEVVHTLSRYAELAREEDTWWELQVREAWDSACTEHDPVSVSFDLEMLRGMHTAVLRRLLRRAVEELLGSLSGIHQVHLEPLVAAIPLEKPGKSIRFPGGIEARQSSGKLVIRKLRAVSAGAGPGEVEIDRPGAYSFGPLLFQFDIAAESSGREQTGPECARMDADKVAWPLRLRLWLPGDRFRPAGMRGSKKLQDFFIDSRIPREERHAVPILCDRDKICWVAGLRLDERVKAGPDTKRVLTARLEKNPADTETAPHSGEGAYAGRSD